MNNIPTAYGIQIAMETHQDLTTEIVGRRTQSAEVFWNLLNSGQVLPCGAPTGEQGNDQFVWVLKNPNKLNRRNSKKTKTKITGIWRTHSDPKSTINVQIANKNPVKIKIGSGTGVIPGLNTGKWGTKHENLLLLCKNPGNPDTATKTNSFLLVEIGKLKTKTPKYHSENPTLAMMVGRLVVVSTGTLQEVRKLTDQFKEKIVWIGKDETDYVVAYLHSRTIRGKNNE